MRPGKIIVTFSQLLEVAGKPASFKAEFESAVYRTQRYQQITFFEFYHVNPNEDYAGEDAMDENRFKWLYDNDKPHSIIAASVVRSINHTPDLNIPEPQEPLVANDPATG